jgi:hypothetical protein
MRKSENADGDRGGKQMKNPEKTKGTGDRE